MVTTRVIISHFTHGHYKCHIFLSSLIVTKSVISFSLHSWSPQVSYLSIFTHGRHKCHIFQSSLMVTQVSYLSIFTHGHHKYHILCSSLLLNTCFIFYYQQRPLSCCSCMFLFGISKHDNNTEKVSFQGPILGGIFGAVIRNRDLWMLGIRNEIFGLLICLGVGKSLRI